MRQHNKSILLLPLIATLANCAWGGDEVLDTSPKGVFLAQRAAVRASDWKAYFALDSPPFRERNARIMLMVVLGRAFVRPGDPEAMRIIEKHRLPKDLAREVATTFVILGEDDEARKNKLMASLMRDVNDRIVDILADAVVYTAAQETDAEFLQFVRDAEIEEIVIDGDRATAWRVYNGVPSRREPLWFERIEGKWYSTTKRQYENPRGS